MKRVPQNEKVEGNFWFPKSKYKLSLRLNLNPLQQEVQFQYNEEKLLGSH